MGSCFVFYKGLGVRLECVFINFMMDLYMDEYGYEEIFFLYMVNCISMIGIGQFFKFEEDVFKIKEEDYFLIFIVEVLVINLYCDEILSGDQFLIVYIVYSVCFCFEVGFVGRDICGFICQYQFNKVEFVCFVKSEDFYDELEKLMGYVEKVF